MRRCAKGQRVKARETRRKVLIDARLRHDRGWTDARILDLSRRGLMARASPPPARGSYVEIGRGGQRIVARVVWADHDRFGALAQDAIDLDALAKGEPAPCRETALPARDRRSMPRHPPDDRHLTSRHWGRRLEFVAAVALVCIAAIALAETLQAMLARPLRQIETALGGRG
jgi:hypothetical protein